MMHHLEITRGRQSAAPSLVKHAIRFGRRLREHNIWFYGFPPLIDDKSVVCRINVGARNINIFNDGSFTRSLMEPGGAYDNSAFAAQCQRMHAIYLDMAAHARRCGLKASARANLNIATEERRQS